jgi:beta-glucosidase
MESGIQPVKFSKKVFGNDFAWGVSTAAFQTEGACTESGKGLSIWDVFTKRKGKILNAGNADTACDFYNQYEKDIDLIKAMNIPNFRFSISWTRILPAGAGTVNQEGIAHYNKVIAYCLQHGIEPWITLYHWDLPQELELKGGWTNREIITWFSDFVAICAKAFGDRVKHWMVMNEPGVFTGAGYFLGIHAPGRTGLKNYIPAIHHATLCIGEGARKLRSILPEAIIGSTFSCSYIEPRSDSKRDIEAAKRIDALLNRLFIEPLLGYGYPIDDVPALKGVAKYMVAGDAENMAFEFDFIGIQNYTREIVAHSFFTPYIHAKLIQAKDRGVPLTEMKWEVYPPSIYQMIKKFNNYPEIKNIIITENGAAFPDDVRDGQVEDSLRVAYLESHIQQVLKAKNEGCRVTGYFVWTLTDNFEWAEGYHPRFGLVYIDFKTQQRIIKSSGRWFAAFLKG